MLERTCYIINLCSIGQMLPSQTHHQLYCVNELSVYGRVAGVMQMTNILMGI